MGNIHNSNSGVEPLSTVAFLRDCEYFPMHEICTYTVAWYGGVVGLLYTTNYVDFDENDWRQVSVDPPEFEAAANFVTLDIFDISQKTYKLKFAKGARVRSFRVVGKFRLTWDDAHLLGRS